MTNCLYSKKGMPWLRFSSLVRSVMSVCSSAKPGKTKQTEITQKASVLGPFSNHNPLLGSPSSICCYASEICSQANVIINPTAAKSFRICMILVKEIVDQKLEGTFQICCNVLSQRKTCSTWSYSTLVFSCLPLHLPESTVQCGMQANIFPTTIEGSQIHFEALIQNMCVN